MRSLGTRDIEVAHRRAAQAMQELEAAHKAKQEGETRWRDAEEFSRLLELSEVLDPQTAAEQYTGKRAQDDVSGAFLDKNTEALAQALLKREVPATWNDLIREVERIRIRKNLSPFSASWRSTRLLDSCGWQIRPTQLCTPLTCQCSQHFMPSGWLQ